MKSVESGVESQNVGVTKATAVASAINALVAIPPAHEGKPTDFNDLHMWRGLEAVRMCVDAADYVVKEETEEAKPSRAANAANRAAENKENSFANIDTYGNAAVAAVAAGMNVEKPIPLRSTPQAQVAYPVEALGPFAGTVAALHKGVQVPESMAASSVLTALAFCAQKVANVSTRDGRTIPLSLYCLTVADSGDRKTGVDKVVYEAIKNIERELYTQYQIEMKSFNHAKESYDNLSKKDKELCTFELEEPKNPTMLKEDITIEGLFRSFKEGQPSLALFSDEGGTLFGGHSMKKDTALKSITFFSKLWDGSEVDKVRSGEGFARLYDRRLSMHLMIQPIIAKEVFSNPLFQGQGFLPRFLFTWPQSLKGTRVYSDDNVRLNEHVQSFYRVCEQLVHMPVNIDETTGAIIFNTITLDDEAHELWVDHHNRVEKLLSIDGDFTLISANVSKCAEQSLRIAGVLTLATNPNARVITYDTMYDAIEISQWYLKEILRLQQDGVAGEDILRAEKLLHWLKKKELTVFTERYAVKYCHTSLRKSSIIKECLHILEAHKYIRRGFGEVIFDGHATKDFWEVSPCAL